MFVIYFCKVTLKVNDGNVTSNNNSLQLIFSTSLYYVFQLLLLCFQRHYTLCFSVTATCENAFSISTIIAIRSTRKRNKIKNKGSIMDGTIITK